MRASSLRKVPFYRERRENCWQVLRYGVLLRSRRSFLPRTARAMLPRAKGRSSRSGSTTEISSSSSRNIRDTVARAVAQIQRSYSPSDTQLASTVGRCAQSPVLPLPVSRQTQRAPLHRWLDTLAHDARCHRPRLSSRPIIDDFDYSRPIQPPSQVPFALSRRKTTSRLASQLFKHPSVSAWCRRSSQPAFRCESVWRRRSMRPLPASTMQQRPS